MQTCRRCPPANKKQLTNKKTPRKVVTNQIQLRPMKNNVQFARFKFTKNIFT